MSGNVCPVCGKPVTNGCCFHCGYDETKDHLKHRSLAPVSGVSAMERRICLTRLKLRESAPRGKSSTTSHFADAAVRSYITFGRYPQDNADTPAPIEWLVLSRKEDRILVISRYALDCKPYSTISAYATLQDGTKAPYANWEICSLRRWLNDTFLNSAFTSEEQAMIPTVTLRAEYTSLSSSTKDRVFLLSIPQVTRLFSSNAVRKCVPTRYAMISAPDSCMWWLRSPGDGSLHASCVDSDGHVDSLGFYVDHSGIGVRPALWIMLNP